VSVVKATAYACQQIRQILQNHRVVFEERDVFLNSEFAEELEARLPGATVPQIFINGAHFGVCLACNHIMHTRHYGGGSQSK
jgi:glutaredoxin domain-containing cysteine-rich protein 1